MTHSSMKSCLIRCAAAAQTILLVTSASAGNVLAEDAVFDVAGDPSIEATWTEPDSDGDLESGSDADLEVRYDLDMEAVSDTDSFPSAADSESGVDVESLYDPSDEQADFERAVEEAEELSDDSEDSELSFSEEGAQLEEDSEDLAGSADEEFDLDEIVETAFIEDPIVTDPDDASIADIDQDHRLVGAGEDGSDFTDFYDQLEEPSKVFYNYRFEHFAKNRRTDALVMTFTKDQSPYSFTCPVAETSSGGKTADKSSEEYIAGHEQVLYLLRASFDAFYYDHPEVFWTRGTKVSVKYGGTVKNETATLFIKEVKLTPAEAFKGSAGLIPDFDASVANVIATIRKESDFDRNGTVEVSELLQGIHEYVISTCYYDSEGLNTYKDTGDYRIFTPAGVFLESVGRGVVCEGYSRAIKILCDQLGIKNALVRGKASAEAEIGHQWNAIYLDECWFIIDATWNDLSTTGRYKYYLCYQISGRIVSDTLGGADRIDGDYTTRSMPVTFPAVPDGTHSFAKTEVLDNGCETCTVYGCGEAGHPDLKYYMVEGEHKSEAVPAVEPTCTEVGSTEGSKCPVCGFFLVKPEVIPALGHAPETVPGKAPTCTESGLTDGEKCSACGEMLKAQTAIPALGHTPEKVPGKAPTCTESGLTDGEKCSVCGDVLKAQTKIPAAGHKAVTDPAVAPTTSTEGLTEGSHCSVCGTVLKAQETVPKVPVTLTVTAKGMKNKKVTMKKGKSLQLKVTSNAPVTYKSSNKKVATVSSKGKIKAKAKGKAKITVKAGNKTVKITVTVKA